MRPIMGAGRGGVSRWALPCAALACLALGAGSDVADARQKQTPPPARFAKEAAPMIAKYCFPCHAGSTPAGGANLAAAKSEEDLRANPGVWARAAENLRSGRMPPVGAAQPDSKQREAAADAIEAVLTDCLRPDPGRVTIRRLNRAEYDNTIRDLVGLDLGLAGDFPSDDVGEGFDNIGDVLSLSPLLMEKYLAAAETIAQKAIVVPENRSTVFEGDDLRFDAGVNPLPSGERVMFTNAEVYGVREFPKGGAYRIRVRAYGQQAGPDPARMAILLDGRELARFDVLAVRAKPQFYEVPVELASGRHRIGAAFLNDYYKPDAANPADRDRNLAVDSIEVVGPAGAAPQLPPSHVRIVTAVPSGELSREEATRRVLQAFASRAFRRPATADEVDKLVRIALMAQREGEPYERGLQLGVEAVLASPQFLFRVELDADRAGEVRELNAYELASRMAYFLWSSMPDARLEALAASGELLRPDVRRQELGRMLKDPKSEALGQNFAEQWLQLRKLQIVAPNKDQFPTFGPEMRDAMRRETLLFFQEIQRQDRSVLEFLDGKFTYVNGLLAKHYGIPGVQGPAFVRVALDGKRRAGVLTQASVLTVTSNPTRTSPVKRGKWILEQILGTPPPPPPPGVSDLKESEAVKGATMRQLLEKHRENPMCASCHARMDPLGFGLENFDAVGQWRDREGPAPVDATGVLPDGTKFNGPAQLRKILLARKEQFVKTFAEKMLVYALGRGLTLTDRCHVDTIAEHAKKSGYRFSSIVEAVVESDPFLKRRG
ncbi:MAG: DUF1592 domain-containing protein [Fimbriimonadaceae bacterium]|nr:DUF1592 domain-containing protein [Chthonomonadaceae bacterium]MCO5296569.1 DUF1592 domain-containing protein [Fimbriimonadaceae bacterium]